MLIPNYGITVADFIFSESVTMIVTVADPDFKLLKEIRNDFVTDGIVLEAIHCAIIPRTLFI